jgi:hypothetical protein
MARHTRPNPVITNVTLGPLLRQELRALNAAGVGHYTLAGALNAQQIPTPSGRGFWHGASVRQYTEPERWAAYQRAHYAARRRS